MRANGQQQSGQASKTTPSDEQRQVNALIEVHDLAQVLGGPDSAGVHETNLVDSICPCWTAGVGDFPDRQAEAIVG